MTTKSAASTVLLEGFGDIKFDKDYLKLARERLKRNKVGSEEIS